MSNTYIKIQQAIKNTCMFQNKNYWYAGIIAPIAHPDSVENVYSQTTMHEIKFIVAILVYDMSGELPYHSSLNILSSMHIMTILFRFQIASIVNSSIVSISESRPVGGIFANFIKNTYLHNAYKHSVLSIFSLTSE